MHANGSLIQRLLRGLEPPPAELQAWTGVIKSEYLLFAEKMLKVLTI